RPRPRGSRAIAASGWSPAPAAAGLGARGHVVTEHVAWHAAGIASDGSRRMVGPRHNIKALVTTAASATRRESGPRLMRRRVVVGPRLQPAQDIGASQAEPFVGQLSDDVASELAVHALGQHDAVGGVGEQAARQISGALT